MAGTWIGLLSFALFFLPGEGSTRQPPAELAPPVGAMRLPSPGESRLTVRVLDGRGMPLEAGEVVVRAGEGQVVRALDRSGRAIFDELPSGEAAVIAIVPGFARQTKAVFLADTPSEVELGLQEAASFRGRLVAPSGEGIGGVNVRVSHPELPPWTITSAEDGGFAIDTLPAGPFELSVAVAGYEDVTQRVSAPGEVRILLLPTADLHGLVQAQDGTPAADARVTIAGSGLWPPRELRTDGKGSFRIEDLPPGVYEVRADRGEEIAPPREGLSLEAGASVEVTLRLEPGASLVGTVVDAQSGRPIGDAEVTVSEESLALLPRTTKTDAEGRFRLGGLRPRSHQVSVMAKGYVPFAGNRPIAGGGDEAFKLRRGATLTGIVVDERDRPIPFALLEVVGIDDAGGKFTTGGLDFGLRHQLVEGASATGHLGVTAGKPPKVGAIPALPSSALASGPALPFPGQTADASGRFTLEGVTPGKVQVVARAPGHAPGKTPMRFVAGGGRVEGLTIRLPSAGAIAGRLVDGRGFPLPRVAVELHDERDPMPRLAVSSPDGSFRFEEAFGAVVLTALLDGRPAARTKVEVHAGETVTVDLVVNEARTTLRGRAFDEDGYPLDGVQVSVRALRAESPVDRATRSTPDGRFEIGGLPSGPFQVTAEKAGYATTRVETRAEPNEALQIILRTGAAIRGRVVDDWTGEPIAGASVRVRAKRRGEVLGRRPSDTEGRFSFPLLPSGDYEIFISHAEYADSRVEASLRATRRGLDDLELEVVRLSPGGSIVGEVVDRYGDPVPGASISVVEAGPKHATRSDVQGRFRLTGIPAGRVAIVARHDAAGETESAPLAVRIKEETDAGRIRLPDRFEPDRVPETDGMHTGVAVRVVAGRPGPRIGAVVGGTAAERAGLRVGDALRTVDGQPIHSVADAERHLRGPVGVEAILEVVRANQIRRIPVARERYVLPE